MNKIELIITSVGYDDYLKETLKFNTKIFDTIHVCTSTRDKKTQIECEKYKEKVNVIKTEVFFENKNPFNKGRAINKGIENLRYNDWVIIGDADCIYPENVKREIEYQEKEKEIDGLFTFYRVSVNSRKELLDFLKNNTNKFNIERGYTVGVGYCQIFHQSSIYIKNKFYYPEDCEDASWSDILFARLWPKSKRKILNGLVIHLGELNTNWRGRVTKKWE